MPFMNNTLSVKFLSRKLSFRLALLLGVPLLLFTSSIPADFPDHPGSLDGIVILFDTEPQMFPPSWYSAQVSAHAVSLQDNYRKEAKDILNKAIEKYPEEVLFHNLRKVYILESLHFFGVPYGGTNTKNIIYLTFTYSGNGQNLSFAEGLFHHELSSVLFRNYRHLIDTTAWMNLNPPGFGYRTGSIEAIRRGRASMQIDELLLDQGFLNQYAQSAFEEDMNVTAQNLFSGGNTFWAIVDSHDRIRAKVNLIIRFYHQISPVFTEAYFRSLAPSV